MYVNNGYLDEVYHMAKARDPHESEFLQAVLEVLTSLVPVLEQTPELCPKGILERLIEPERFIQFRVAWKDRNNDVKVNRGYRVQYNSLLGPYKGGLRFHQSVTPSVIKFLGFEQTFKNSLTNLPLGGGKGGSDFDPHGKTNDEVMAFCQNFMNKLYRHIGATTDVPAGDIGVGNREIGYLYGQYCRLRNISEGTITGKGLFAGGSLLRNEATGYGLCYFAQEMLSKLLGTTLEGKTLVVSGSGNVSIYAIEKAHQLGGKVLACSDSRGYIIDEEGIDVEILKQIKEVERARISEYPNRKPGATYHEGSEGIWTIPCDVAAPCATENEISLAAANNLIRNKTLAIVEGSNMSSTVEALELFQQENIIYAPAKAANAGGVAVSGLEMAQNAMHSYWSYEEIDQKLQHIMKSIFAQSYDTSQMYGDSGNLLLGANIAGFSKVSRAMQWAGVG